MNLSELVHTGEMTIKQNRVLEREDLERLGAVVKDAGLLISETKGDEYLLQIVDVVDDGKMV